MYRPENISGIQSNAFDLNLVYWSYDGKFLNFKSKLFYYLKLISFIQILVMSVNFMKNVAGKCYLLYAGATDVDIEEWTAKGPYRFYFNEIYDSKEEKVKPVTGGLPASIGGVAKGNNKKECP